MMSAIHRFNAFVSTATVTLTFTIISFLIPVIQDLGVPLKISGIAISGLATVSVYKIVAGFLLTFIDRVRLVKRFVFGPAYIEGTWVGRFNSGVSGPKWTVEKIVQSLAGIVINGEATNEDGTNYGFWKSKPVSIDAEEGSLTYAYECYMMDEMTSHQGIGYFQFDRSASWKPPTSLNGFAADLPNGIRSENRERKISNAQMDTQQAMAKARQGAGLTPNGPTT